MDIFLLIYLYCSYVLINNAPSVFTLLLSLDTLISGIHFYSGCCSPWIQVKNQWFVILLTPDYSIVFRYLCYFLYSITIWCLQLWLWSSLPGIYWITWFLSIPFFLNWLMDSLEEYYKKIVYQVQRSVAFLLSAIIVSILNRFASVVLEANPQISLGSFFQIVHERDITWTAKFIQTLFFAFLFLTLERDNTNSMYITLSLKILTFWRPNLKFEGIASLKVDKQELLTILMSENYTRLQDFDVVVKALRLIVHHKRGELQEKIRLWRDNTLYYLTCLSSRPFTLQLFGYIIGYPKITVLLISLSFWLVRFFCQQKHEGSAQAQYLFLKEYKNLTPTELRRHLWICLALKLILSCAAFESRWLAYYLELSELLAHQMVQRFCCYVMRKAHEVKNLWLYHNMDLPILLFLVLLKLTTIHSMFAVCTGLVMMVLGKRGELLSFVMIFGSLSNFHLLHLICLSITLGLYYRICFIMNESNRNLLEHMIITEYTKFIESRKSAPLCLISKNMIVDEEKQIEGEIYQMVDIKEYYMIPQNHQQLTKLDIE